MDLYAPHKRLIEAAWDAVEHRVDGLPPSLAALGRGFLAAISTGGAGHRRYFSSEISPPLLYIPLWLRDRFRREGGWPEAIELDPWQPILLAGMWGYFYIRIQDDIIDGSDAGEPLLPLFGNICCAEMFAQLRAVAAGAPDFWPAFERAWTDFSRFTLEEQRQVRDAGGYPAHLFEAHAQKVAFARIPALAACAVAGRLDLEGAVGALVHRLGVAYGLVNDVLGWPRDLRAGQRTYLLARAGLSAAEARACDASSDPERAAGALDDRLRRALYDEGLLCAALDEAEAWQRRAAEEGAPLELPELDAYTEERSRWLQAQRARIQLLQLQRALGAH